MVKVTANFKPRSFANNVEIFIPVPPDVDSPAFKASLGGVTYVPDVDAVKWSLKQLRGGSTALMRAHFGLPSVASGAWLRLPAPARACSRQGRPHRSRGDRSRHACASSQPPRPCAPACDPTRCLPARLQTRATAPPGAAAPSACASRSRTSPSRASRCVRPAAGCCLQAAAAGCCAVCAAHCLQVSDTASLRHRSACATSPHTQCLPACPPACLQVRYLKVLEKSGYAALPWVRYITQNGDYQLRMT